MRVVYWGTYDLGKPRNRILLRGLRENGVDVVEIHADVWSGVEDKSGIAGRWRRLRFLLRWLSAYPGLIARYLRAPRHDAVVIGYLGQFDVLVLWSFARLRGVPIVWDAFLSLYDTVVEDRGLLSPRHPAAWLLFAVEWLACRAAWRIVLDTRAHVDYFTATFGVAPERFAVAFVGVEPEAFPRRPDGARHRAEGAPLTVLFYGQFIPLHGIDTIVRAAQMTADERIDWVLIGCGQITQREPDPNAALSPMDLTAAAARQALEDTEAGTALAEALDTIVMLRSFSDTSWARASFPTTTPSAARFASRTSGSPSWEGSSPEPGPVRARDSGGAI